MKPRMLCRCGKEISNNTLLRHINSKGCLATEEEKEEVREIAGMIKNHKYGWLKKEGENAIHDTEWWLSIYNKGTTLDDWTFTPPRPMNMVTPNSAKKFSIDRKGVGNPAVKNAPKYDVALVKAYCKEVFGGLGSLYQKLPQAILVVERKFPKFRYSLCGIIPKKKIHSSLFAWALDISVEEAQKIMIRNRGERISKRQKASPFCIASASAQAAKLSSGWRISKSQEELYQLVKEIDSQATMEKRVGGNGRTYSYDIFAPKFNCLIEMHGDFWHKPLAKPIKSDRVRKMIEKNLLNDPIKESLAKERGFRFLVFWESEKGRWKTQLEEGLG